MKKLHLFLAAAVIAIFFIPINILSQNCNYIWSLQNSGTLNAFYTVKAVNSQVCWTGGASAIVSRTTDGGTTWLNANPNPGVITGQVNNIDAIDGNTAWATTTNGGGTFIYKTINGGVNWLQVFSSAQTRIFGIKMTDANSGFAFGDPVSNVWQMLVTSNGGLNWSLSPNAPAVQINIETCLPNVFFVSLPNIYWGTSVTTIFRSTNSGLNFTSHPANVTGIYVLSLFYNASGTGLSASTTMSKTIDGGLNYSALPAPGAGNINGIQGESNNFWYVRGNGIYQSTNAGSDWLQVFSAPQSLNHLDFPDGLTGCQTGWAVGFGGTICKLTSSVTGVNLLNSEIPVGYSLSQNYPNPFNPQTVINFSVPKAGYTELKVYDILGNEIAVLIKQELGAGNYSVNYVPENISGGIYFYSLRSGNYSGTRKMMLAK